MSAKIVILGSINVDMVIQSTKVPRMGETVMGSGFVTIAGGKGANQGVAVARLLRGGETAAFIGAVGIDDFGAIMRGNLETNGLDVTHVKVADGCATGTAVIIVYEGDNFIVIDSGANAELTVDDVATAAELIRGADILIAQLEVPLETVRAALALAKESGVTTLLNPAPARALDPELLALVDIITPNETECQTLTGVDATTIEGGKRGVQALLALGVKQAIVTMGGNGAAFNEGSEIVHTPSMKADAVVDTTAAGDSFTGALAVALTEGKSIREAVRFASAVGAITVATLGAQPSLPMRAAVEAKLK